MGCEKACIFMNVNICMCVPVCSHTVCAFQSPATSSSHLEHPHVDCQKQRFLSAVRRNRDCWLGDHYEGHKRAIYRTASEWSHHQPPHLTPTHIHAHSHTHTLFPALHHARSPTKSPKWRIRGEWRAWWLKHEGEGHGSFSGICFMTCGSKQGNKVPVHFWSDNRMPQKVQHFQKAQKTSLS